MSTSGPLIATFLEARQDLIRFFRGKLGCPDQAADLTQDVWLRLARVDNPEAIANPRGYVFRIAENLVTDQLRKRLSRATDTSAGLQDEIPCPAPGPEQQALADQQFRLLQQAIEELPAKCREAFLMQRIEGLSYAEIAARQGISVKTVEKHLSKALDHCRAKLLSADSD